jgi:hypothetical protein
MSSESEDGIPIVVDSEETTPVDADTMLQAARRSTMVPDTSTSANVVSRKRMATQAAPDEPELKAEVFLAGGKGGVELPVQNASPSGLALMVPAGIDLSLATGVAVTVRLHRSGSDTIDVKLSASVVHVRPAAADVPGGVSMRWTDVSREQAQRILSGQT